MKPHIGSGVIYELFHMNFTSVKIVEISKELQG